MTTSRWITRAGLLAAAPILLACTPRTVEVASGGDVIASRSVMLTNTLATYPAKQRETASMIMTKYGQPDVVSNDVIIWHNKGPFVKIALMRNAVAHNFPMAHQDFLTQTIRHTVPADKLDELWAYDGSVWAHRTRGELSAQCDIEPFNLLALNLAHDVMTNRRTVSDARAFYAKTAMAYKNGDHSSPYTSGLIFTTESNAADPDRPHQM